VRLVEDASGRRLYVCMRCGNKFWSRAKKPQCSVCRSKRVVPYEEFLKLSQEEQERILGKRSEEDKPKPAEVREEQGKKSEKLVKSEEVEQVKPGEKREVGVKREESPKITQEERVKKEDSPKITRVKKEEKPGEKVKGERVKKGFKVPLPKLSWKAYAIVGGLAFAYYLYHIGWFDEMLRQLKRLGAVKDLPDDEPEPSNSLLEKARRNISGGR